MFSVNHSKSGTLLTPTRQWKIKFLSMIKCFTTPLQNMQNEFEINRKNNIYKLTHNSQICKLAAVLNDTFDMAQRRIYITDGGDHEVTLIHRDSDQKLLQLPIIVHRDEDYGDSGYDFVVAIPTDIDFTQEVELHMKSNINFYKLAGKRYKINVA